MTDEDREDAAAGSSVPDEAAAERDASLPGPSGPPAAWNPEEQDADGELPGSAAHSDDPDDVQP